MTATRLATPGRLGRAWLAFLALLLVATATQPLWLGPMMSWQLSGASGRSVAIESMQVGLTSELTPVVRLRGIAIQNAAWADTTKPFAVVGEAVAIVSWRSALQQRPVIERLVLHDGEIDLERQADGLRNWRLRDPENRGPGVYKLLALQAERTSLRFRHDGIELDLVAKATPEAEPGAGDDALPMHIDLAGTWRTLPFTASLATGPVLSFFETGATFPLRGRLDAGGARFDAVGRAGDMFRAPVFDARVTLTGDSLAPFRAFLGPRHDGQAKKAFRVEGRLEAGAGLYALSAARVRIGGSDLAGDLAWARHDRPMLRATLQGNSVDLADLRWLAGRAPVAAARQRIADPGDENRYLRATDAAVRVDVRKVRAAELPWLRSLAFEAVLTDGMLAVPTFDAGVFQAGRTTGRLGFDLRKRPAALEAEVALRGLRLETLFAAQTEDKRVTGLLHADMRVTASGESADALRDSASGSVRARLTGGSMPGLLDAQIGLQGGRMLRSWIAGSERVAIRCATAALDLRGGAGRVHSLMLDTERTRTTGSGRIDLGAGTIDLVLTPESKQGGLLVLDRSIRLHGPFSKPARELVGRAEVVTGSSAASCAG